MKIISGKNRGKSLKCLEGETTRPTIARVKEAIFSSIQFDIIDSTVLDLFAGTGQMGLECLSRSAKCAYFADSDNSAFMVLKDNIKACGDEENAVAKNLDYKKMLEQIKGNKIDIIFLDPPYGGKLLENALFSIENIDILNENGIIICESAVTDNFEIPSSLKVVKEYKYGTILITKLKKV